jgi:hypothetical protein
LTAYLPIAQDIFRSPGPLRRKGLTTLWEVLPSLQTVAMVERMGKRHGVNGNNGVISAADTPVGTSKNVDQIMMTGTQICSYTRYVVTGICEPRTTGVY